MKRIPPAIAKAKKMSENAIAIPTYGSVLRVDSTLRAMQFSPKRDERIAIHGGNDIEGILNINTFGVVNSTTLFPHIERNAVLNGLTGLTSEGYVINNGASFLMVVELSPEGPVCNAILAFSQSDDPESSFFADQTRLFSNKQWRSCLYNQELIQADPTLRTYQVHNLEGDLDNDGDVDRVDAMMVFSARNQVVTIENQKLDIDQDGIISIFDVRKLVNLCTHPHCE